MQRNVFWLFPLLTVFVTQSMFSDEPKQQLGYRDQWNAVSVPKKTPFDEKPKLASQYLNSYRDGYVWAQGLHVVCPTNPSERNLHAIRGWVEGWQAGVKAGGIGPLPAKYGEFLKWNDPS